MEKKLKAVYNVHLFLYGPAKLKKNGLLNSSHARTKKKNKKTEPCPCVSASELYSKKKKATGNIEMYNSNNNNNNTRFASVKRDLKKVRAATDRE